MDRASMKQIRKPKKMNTFSNTTESRILFQNITIIVVTGIAFKVFTVHSLTDQGVCFKNQREKIPYITK